MIDFLTYGGFTALIAAITGLSIAGRNHKH